MKLTIAPLSTPLSITAAAQQAIIAADRLFIQTEQHPSAYWLKDSGIEYGSMDDLYESCYDFDELNAAIAQRLLEGDTDTVYAPVGRGVGSALLEAIRTRADETGAKLCILSASGYAEAALCAAGQPTGSVRILSANELPCRIDTSVPLCIEEVDTPIRAGEVKLALGEYYPDEHGVTLACMDGRGAYHCSDIKLYELDRQRNSFFAATVLIVPPAALEQLDRHGMDSLVDVLKRLRGENGCPWDREQTHMSLRNTMIEEAYEAVDAIERDDTDALCEELGDVLLQIVFHAQIETEASDFTIRDVTTGIVKKLMYRHPHVFSALKVSGTEEVLKNWEELKKKEKHIHSAATGFDMDTSAALSAVTEAAERIRTEYADSADKDTLYLLAEELLFAAVYVMRALGLDAELTLRDAGSAFLDAFAKVEHESRQNGTELGPLTPDGLHALLQRAK